MNGFKYASETLHIALVSISQGQSREHIDSLIKNYYESYKKNIALYSKVTGDASNTYLYNPLQYFIFGNYDIALISLVNNYKFSQKQPTPDIAAGPFPYLTEPNLFQVITGSCPIINDNFNVEQFFKSKQEKTETFICISNLKLNNKLLIGNGNNFLEPVLINIDKKLRDAFGVKKKEVPSNYFLQQTYSWCEITLVIFSDEINKITETLTGLRKLSLDDLFETDRDKKKKMLLKNSLYDNVLSRADQYKKINPHVFADSHSYFGVDLKSLGDPDKHTILSQNLKTQIEWQVKPGHFADLRGELEKVMVNGLPVFSKENFLLTGKTDFFIQEKTDSFLNNVKLIEQLNSNPDIFKYVRKVKSRILLDYETDSIEANKHAEFHPEFNKYLQQKFSNGEFNPTKFNGFLKELKISRNIRSKINKIFFNYNNGILDPILFTYFLDFKIFMDNLASLITKERNDYLESFINAESAGDLDAHGVDNIENALIHMIEIFEEGYNIRMLNCNQYEDINDFDLDFNSSVQQILSMYGTIAIVIGNIFYERNKRGPVVQLHLKNTVSNFESINYDVYHLTCPEFVFFTLVKEVMNKYIYTNDRFHKSEKSEKQTIRDLIKKLEKEFAEVTPFYDNEIVDIEYYFIDAIRFVHSCNFDFPLFEYWFWTYTFQNASLYDKTGSFNERHFRLELLRLFFIAKLFGIELEKIKCPLPEIYYLWERHAKSFIEVINLFFQTKRHSISSFKMRVLSVFQYERSYDPPTGKVPGEAVAINITEKIRACMTAKDVQHFEAKDAYNTVNLSLCIMQKSSKMAETINNGYPVYCNNTEADDYLFINSFIYAYLKLIFDKNKSIRLLRRNWQDGSPLLSFINIDKEQQDDFLYSVDQFGGIFFSSDKNSEEYFKIRNATLQTLWHYSLLCKKSIYFSK